ncbi:alpha-amylase family glycosyl hydrolase [Limnohabitans sp. 2KL-1]|uniref:alpha-amylase family glycosyl hydrolase n=1 Tax=Limnohabitans sp. 2KL-1 TaxID=1100699 RepID=UPI001304F932|nr:alpha-amylase family glycosyl hydrolase [Limnohabitans sp. 2KL-1]
MPCLSRLFCGSKVLVACVLAAALSAPLAGAQVPVDLSPVPAQLRPSALSEGWQHGAFMEIFVRSWRDGDGDGVGDLRGLTQSLDDLQKLGVRGLWLMPITRSADGDHGYATTDYRDIEPAYGTLADFDELIRQAHARGIGVIMDYVVNHSADTHPLFVQSARDPAGPYRTWFEWRQTHPEGWDIWGRDPWVSTGQGSYLATFGAPMPDFNLRHPPVVAYHQDSLRFWLNRGLDGMRLDAVPHLIENSAQDWNDQPESRQLTGDLTRLIKSYPGRYVVCEATAQPRAYANTEVCGGSFAFGLESQIVPAAKGDEKAIREVAQYFVSAPHTLATFVSNHDRFAGQRLWDQVDGNEAQYKLAAATYLLLPGTPFIYYGEDIGMAGAQGLTEDPKLRGPLSWAPDARTGGFTTGQPYRALATNVATHSVQGQQRDPQSIWSFYRDMLALRNSRVSIARGSYEFAQTQGQAMAYQRRFGKEHSLVVIHYGQQPATLTIEGLAPDARLRPLYPAGAARRLSSRQLTVPAQSVQVFALEE